MANNENLVSLATRTQQERQEIARKGNEASTKVRREKRTFKEAIQWLANSDIKITQGSMFDLMKANGIDTSKLNTTQMATLGLWWGAVQGNSTNFKTLMEGNNEIAEAGTETPKLQVEIVDNSNLERTLYEKNRPNEDVKGE